jgi:hypothetical protein
MTGGAKPGEKFPALFEYHPRRKDDATAAIIRWEEAMPRDHR